MEYILDDNRNNRDRHHDHHRRLNHQEDRRGDRDQHHHLRGSGMRYVRVDERDEVVHPIRFHDEYHHRHNSASHEYDGDSEPSDPSSDRLIDSRMLRERRDSAQSVHSNSSDSHHSMHSHESIAAYSDSMQSDVPIVVPNPKYWRRLSSLPLPSYRHFMLQNNTLFSMRLLHCTLLPASRVLLQFNPLFLPNTATRLNPRNKFENLQSMTSHKGHALNQAATQLMKFSNIMLSHTYCMLHVAAASILPVIGLRRVISGNLSPDLQNAVNPINIHANPATVLFVANLRNGNGNDGNNNNNNSDDDDLNAEDQERMEQER